MNIIDAAHKTVHAYPGGSESLGPRIGMAAAVMRNKVNPNNTTHHLTLAEASEIMGVTGDFRILHALAGEHGFTLQRIESAADAACVVSAHLGATAEQGELAQVLAMALADNDVTFNEAREIAQAGADLQAAIVHLVSAAWGRASRARPGGGA